MTGISVVVPTRDRPDRLAVCLAALERQTAPGLEIVVVDDGSRDAQAVAAAVAAAPRARLVTGAGRGPAAARNLGARSAVAPVLCFTDDDCAPVPGWALELATEITASPDVHAAAGPTRNAVPGNPFAAAAQAVASHLAEATIAAGRMRFAPTSNLAVRADVLADVAFDERYPLAAGEDRDWCARLTASGRAIAFVPAAVVDHYQELDARGFWHQQVRYGRGAYRFRADHGTLARPEPPAFYAGLLRRGFALGALPGLLVCAAQVATAWGIGREARAARRDRRAEQDR